MDKNDINLMHLKESKSKKVDGAVFGNLKKVVDYHPIGKYTLDEFDGKSLNEILSEFLKYKKETEDKFDAVINVLKHQKEKIRELKEALERYGL